MPVLLGAGTRLFDHLGAEPIELERTRVVESPVSVTHLSFRALILLVRGGLARGRSLEGFTRLPEGPLQSIAAIRDDCDQPIWFPQGVWHVPGEDLERVGTAVAALLGRTDQVRERDLAPPDDVAIFQGPRGAPVANVHYQNAITAGQYLIE